MGGGNVTIVVLVPILRLLESPGRGGGGRENFNILGGGKGERKRGKFYREGGKEKEKEGGGEGGGL